jgi:hypothetical protein
VPVTIVFSAALFLKNLPLVSSFEQFAATILNTIPLNSKLQSFLLISTLFNPILYGQRLSFWLICLESPIHVGLRLSFVSSPPGPNTVCQSKYHRLSSGRSSYRSGRLAKVPAPVVAAEESHSYSYLNLCVQVHYLDIHVNPTVLAVFVSSCVLGIYCTYRLCYLRRYATLSRWNPRSLKVV